MTLLTSQKFLTIILRVEIADDRLAVRKKEAHPLGLNYSPSFNKQI